MIRLQMCSQPRYIVLIGHGLNNSEYTLRETARLIDGMNASIVYLTLSGHQTNDRVHHTHWDDAWCRDMREAFVCVKTLSQEHNVPLVFIGFSLSCLVFLNSLNKDSPQFDRIILLSPPLVVQRTYRFIAALKFVGLRFIPSFNRRIYRARSFLPVAMYSALIRLIRSVESGRIPLPKQGIVFLDMRDAVVPYEPVKRFLSRQTGAWQAIPVIGGRKLFHPLSHLLHIEKEAGSATVKLIGDLCRIYLETAKLPVKETLTLSSYEHFFLNEQSEQYPISIFSFLRFKGVLNKERFEHALEMCQNAHPFLRSRINGPEIHRRKHRRWLILNSGFKAFIDWQRGASDFVFPHQSAEIDLIQEVGLRAYVRVDDESSSVTFQIHHACLDGIGAMQVVRDFLSFYRGSHAPNLNVESHILEKRHLSFNRSLVQRFLDIRLISKFASFHASPIAAPSALFGHSPSEDSSPAPSDALSPAPCEVQSLVPTGGHEIDSLGTSPFGFTTSKKIEATFLIRHAQNKNITVNDILTTCLGRALQKWNQSFNAPTNIRVTLPVNLRTAEQFALPACNITGMYFVDFGRQKRSSSEVHAELYEMKNNQFAATFNWVVGLTGLIPYGISLLNRPPKNPSQASTSTCISNLGRIDTWAHETQASSELGSTALIEIIGCAPLRPGTRMTFCFATIKETLQLTALADYKYFKSTDVEHLFELFEQHLLEECAEKQNAD